MCNRTETLFAGLLPSTTASGLGYIQQALWHRSQHDYKAASHRSICCLISCRLAQLQDLLCCGGHNGQTPCGPAPHAAAPESGQRSPG